VSTLIQKLNVKAGLMLLAFAMLGVGTVLCIQGLRTTGQIDIKTTLFEGKITTESLGLVMIAFIIPIVGFIAWLSSKAKRIDVAYGDTKISAVNADEATWKHIQSCLRSHEVQSAGETQRNQKPNDPPRIAA